MGWGWAPGAVPRRMAAPWARGGARADGVTLRPVFAVLTSSHRGVLGRRGGLDWRWPWGAGRAGLIGAVPAGV